MAEKKLLLIGFGISLFISVLNVVATDGMTLLSANGLLYAVGGGLAIALGPIAISLIPAGVHWLIWREKLHGNELAIFAIWLFTCLSMFLASLSQFMNN